jgi:hypothetical protein
MNKYKNPWHRPEDRSWGPEYYENEAPVVCSHRGFIVYEVDVQRSYYYGRPEDTVKQYDYVFEGVCITQRPPTGSPEEVIDIVYKEPRYASAVVRDHLEKHGVWKEVSNAS